MNGNEVKELILSSGVKLWQVAELWGCNDCNFSRRLRKPFNADEVVKIEGIIAKLKQA